MFGIKLLFLLKIVSSFLVGGGLVTGVTVISEKMGPKIGAMLAGVPVPLAISLFFQGMLIEPEQVALEAAPAALTSLSVMGVFIITYIYVSRINWLLALFAAAGMWTIAAVAIRAAGIDGMAEVLPTFLVFAIVSKLILIKIGAQGGHLPEGVTRPKIGLAFRFLAVGTLVAGSVLAGAYASPFWGGLLAMFPIVASSSLVILNLSIGTDFTRHFAGTYFSSAVINLSLYILGVYLFYPLYGVWLGTLLAYIAPICSAFAIYKFDKIRQSKVQTAA